MNDLRKTSAFKRAALGGAMVLSLWACGDDDKPASDTSQPEVEETSPDVEPEVEETSSDVEPEVEETSPEVEDTTPEVEVDTGPELPQPGTFVVGEADLPDEFVFKGVWAGEANRIVAVGNDGVVATQNADGTWQTLSRAEGAELLNGIHGADGQNLWAVGKDGVILPGTVDSFGAGKACERNEECDTGDTCTLDTCVDNVCVATSTGAPGCCGTTFGPWDFEGNTLSPWTQVAAEQVGPFGWQVVARPNRAVSGTHAIWFGDPALETYGGGLHLAATLLSGNIKLPSSGTATLRFNVYLDTEVDSSYDVLAIEVESGGTRTEVWHKRDLPSIPTSTFVAAEADLTAWKDRAIRLRIRFDSIDGTINDFEGPYLDDLRVETACASGAAASTRGPTLWGIHALERDTAFAVGRGGAIMQYNGIRWSAAIGSDVSAVWNGMTGSGNSVALVGNNGRALVSLGAGLEPVATDTVNNLNDVHTPDGETFFAVGDQGTLLHGSGITWTLGSAGLTSSMRGVHGNTANDIYAVGNAGAIAHWDGSSWTPIASPTTKNLLAVWVLGSGSAIIVGQDGVVLEGTATAGFTESTTLVLGSDLLDVWATADGSYVLAVGTTGKIFSRVGGSWSAMTSGTSQALEAVWGTSDSDAWAVGRSGIALRWDGSTWTRTPSSVSSLLSGLWGDAPDRYYAAGAGGALLVWDGVAWNSVVSATTENLRAVFARDNNDVWAVGAKGTVMRFNGLGWGKAPVQGEPDSEGVEQPIGDELLAVWAHSATDAWAVGENGRILRWDGTRWNIVETDWKTALRGIYGVAENDIWAVGTAGHILHFNGEEWQKVDNDSIATLYAIHGDGAGQVVIVGDLGTVLRLER
jgi:hypothetical protein